MATVCKQHAQWNIIIYGQQPLSQSAAHNITRSEAAAAFLSSQEAKSDFLKEIPEFQKNCKNNRFGYRIGKRQRPSWQTRHSIHGWCIATGQLYVSDNIIYPDTVSSPVWTGLYLYFMVIRSKAQLDRMVGGIQMSICLNVTQPI